MKALGILAFAMEMLGKNIISKSEYQQVIVDSETQKLVEKSGVFEFRNSIGQFEHNTKRCLWFYEVGCETLNAKDLPKEITRRRLMLKKSIFGKL